MAWLVQTGSLLVRAHFITKWSYPTPSSSFPIQRAAANQQPLLIVYKQSIVRPAAFKSPLQHCADQCRPEGDRNNSLNNTTPEPFKWWIPSGAESRFAGVCLARWTTTSCAGNWSWSWRRSVSRTVAAGTLTSRLRRRCPAGSSGRKYPQTALQLSIKSPILILRLMTGWATAKGARGPTRRTAPASPTHTSVPLRWRPSGGRGRSPNRQPSPETTPESQVRNKSWRPPPPHPATEVNSIAMTEN